MPLDDHSAAKSLSISRSPSPTASTTSGEDGTDYDQTTSPQSDALPPWTRQAHSSSSSSARRLARPYALHRTASASQQPRHTQLFNTALSASDKALRLFSSLSPLYRVLVLVALFTLGALGILFLAYSHRIFAALGPAAKAWRDLPAGWMLLWLAICATAFPPMIGYSSAVTAAGFVYGFPHGWPIAASATLVGSAASFLTSRGVFASYVHKLVGKDRKFVALSQVLRREGLATLTMIRLCPLPYSLGNGFLATIPTINVWGFAAGTALASPKLLVHIFIGSRLALLADRGDAMTASDKAVNYISMVLSGLLGFAVGLIIYRRTMARAAELSAEDVEAAEDYDDDVTAASAALMRASGADADAAALMDDDDISLWETDGAGDRWDDDGGVVAEEGVKKVQVHVIGKEGWK